MQVFYQCTHLIFVNSCACMYLINISICTYVVLDSYTHGSEDEQCSMSISKMIFYGNWIGMPSSSQGSLYSVDWQDIRSQCNILFSGDSQQDAGSKYMLWEFYHFFKIIIRLTKSHAVMDRKRFSMTMIRISKRNQSKYDR